METLNYSSSRNTLPNSSATRGKVAWRCPSNIALVKYWGKKPVQIPQNPSISFTLSEAYTDTAVQYAPRTKNTPWISFTFENAAKPDFAARIERFFQSLSPLFPFLDKLSFSIQSANSFPHSSGIASSASSMGALALCLCEIEAALYGDNIGGDFYQKASFVARLGSGSASRSVMGPLVIWGDSVDMDESSDYYGTVFHDAKAMFQQFHDDILIVSSGSKAVSSSAGHALMEDNPFASVRYQQARDNLSRLLSALSAGDISTFGEIVEEEAMTLHALMMCSRPSYTLMKPHTLACIEAIRAYRTNQGVPVFFTLDAGPNVHILYPDTAKDQVRPWIDEVLLPLSEHGMIIRDQVGAGPKNLM